MSRNRKEAMTEPKPPGNTWERRLLAPHMQPVILSVILFCGAMASLYYWSISGAWHFADTPSYVDAWQTYLSHGNLDTFRTPLYPCYIGLCQWLGGQAWLQVLIAVHMVCYLAAVGLFFHLLRRLLCGVGNGEAACITTARQALVIYGATLVLAVMPTFQKFLCFGATEGFAVIGSLCMCAAGVRFFSTRRPWPWAILLLVLSLVMVSLRPSLLTIPLALIASAIVLIWIRQYRHRALMLIGTGVVSLAGVAVYCSRIERLTGLFTPSTVSVINQYSAMRLEGYYFPELFKDPSIAAAIDTIDDRNHCNFYARTLYEASDIIGERYGWKTLADYNSEAMTLHPEMRWKLIGSHAIDSVMPPYYKSLVFYILALLFVIFLHRHWRRREQEPWRFASALLMWIYVSGTIATSIIGAQSDWERLNLPAFIVIILMAAWQYGSLIANRPDTDKPTDR